jgi:hypothetical protein
VARVVNDGRIGPDSRYAFLQRDRGLLLLLAKGGKAYNLVVNLPRKRPKADSDADKRRPHADEQRSADSAREARFPWSDSSVLHGLLSGRWSQPPERRAPRRRPRGSSAAGA